MAFCPSCGAPAAGKFCAKCGATLGGESAGSVPPPPQSAPGPQSSQMTANVAGTLAYIPVLIPAIIFLAIAPYNRDKTVRFHAFQSLFLQIAWIVAAIALSIVLSMVSWQLWYFTSRLLNLAVILLAAFLMWKTYQNEKIVLPVIGDIAQKQA